MRVALVGPYPSEPGRTTGGVESSFVSLLAGLTSLRDLELDVLTFTRDDRTPQMDQRDGFRVHRLTVPQRFNNLTFYRGARRALASALAELRPEIVHAQGTLSYGYTCLKVVRAAPVIVSVHGIFRETPKLLTGLRDRIEVSLAGVALERFCVRHAPYLLQPTPYPQEYFGREIGGRVFEVANAVREEFFTLEPKPEQGHVLYAGAVIPGKRVGDLVDAVAHISDATLRIAGGMPQPDYARALAAHTRALRLEDRVEFLGPLPAERMLEEYRRASVLVLPSAQEVSPMAIAEAMAAGVPVVATRVGGVPHLVKEGHTGFLVDVGDAEALAERVSELLGDERLRRSFASNARTDAERFRPAAVAARVRGVYDEALR